VRGGKLPCVFKTCQTDRVPRRGSLPPGFHPHLTSQDEVIQRKLPALAALDGLSPRLTPAQSASGISFKSQFLYFLVYVTRYIDLLWTFYEPKSLYNTVFKIVFIGTSAYTLYLMMNDYKPTHDPNLDTFKVEYLLGASAVLAILFPYKYTITEVRTSSPEARNLVRC
jgi:hypothetical protein